MLNEGSRINHWSANKYLAEGDENLKKVNAWDIRKLLEFILVLIVAGTFSLLTLWLMESSIKYVLYVFEVGLIAIVYLILGNYNMRLVFRKLAIKQINLALVPDLLLIAGSLALIFFEHCGIKESIVQLVVALILTAFLSGYALLNIFGLSTLFSKLELLVFSHIVSFCFSAFLLYGAFLFASTVRNTFFCIAFLFLGVFSAFKHVTCPSKASRRKSLSQSVDLLPIILAVLFYMISWAFIYPQFALLIGTDISRHFAWSIALSRTPDLYTGTAYLLAHLYQAAFISLSNGSLVPVQTMLVSLNVMLPLAFYAMAKSHLEIFDKRLPSLATLFWVLFTNGFGGFAWIYFTNLKLSTTGQTQLQLLENAADKTYNETFYGILGLWYVPATISFVLLLMLISLIRKSEIPRSKYFALFSAVTAALYLTHAPGAVVFAIFLAIYGAISRNKRLRIDDSIKASIMSFALVAVVYCVLSQFSERFTFGLSLLASLTVPILVLASSLAVRSLVGRVRLTRPEIWVGVKSILKGLVLFLPLAYIVSFLSWASITDSFHTWQVDAIGLVPWFMYPLMLGLNGLLAIIALYHIAQNTRSHWAFVFFIAFMFFAFIIGKAVSTINLHFFDAGYSEKRFIWFMKLPLAILAPLPILFFVDRLKTRVVSVRFKTVVSATLVGLIVLCGISTTFLNVEYWSLVSNDPARILTPEERDAIDALTKIFDKDPKAWLATVTYASEAIATFAAPSDVLVNKQLLYTARGPEMAFTQLYRHPAYTHPYIYLHNRDLEHLNTFSDRFFARYLPIIPIIFDESEVKIYNVSKPSFPQPNSETTLVRPLDQLLGQKVQYLVYDVLSNGFYNYTVSYDVDDSILDAKTIILPFDPSEENRITGIFSDQFDQRLEAWATLKGSWRIEKSELVGGESGKYGEGILLSPVFAENFAASFKVKPLSMDAEALNYVSLVYSWQDQRNYRIADILFHSDGYLCVHFRTIIDGVEEVLPTWPGVKTDLRWDIGNEYNVTITVNGTLNRISINNEPYLSLNLENISGTIGLRYLGFNEVSFDYFTIVSDTTVKVRPNQEYLDYLHSGGRIVVFNTAGNAFFGENMFFVSNSTVNAQKIYGFSEVDLPVDVPVPELTLKDSSVTALSYYMSSEGRSPFIMRKSFDEGELFYVNMHPIFEVMNEKNRHSGFYEILGKLLSDIDLRRLNPDTELDVDAYVREISAKAGVTVGSYSLLFPLKLNIAQVNVTSEDGTCMFNNVTGIAIKECSRITLEADSALISNGEGFYSALKVNSTFAIYSSQGLMNLIITTNKGDIEISDVYHVSVTPRDFIQVLARTPTVRSPEVTFIEFYSFGSLAWKTRTHGQNLKATGTNEFAIELSDTYTLLRNVKLHSSFERDPPIVVFDELSTIRTAIFWLLLVSPIYVGTLILVRYRSSEKRQDLLIKK